MAKEKTGAAEKTPDMLKKKRGRPSTGNAMTGAERVAKHRKNLLGDRMESTCKRLAEQFDLPLSEVKKNLYDLRYVTEIGHKPG